MEYKWKLRENGTDMFVSDSFGSTSCHVQHECYAQCIDSRDKHVAVWSGENRRLQVAPRCIAILDRIVVTCFLNIWFKRLGQW